MIPTIHSTPSSTTHSSAVSPRPSPTLLTDDLTANVSVTILSSAIITGVLALMILTAVIVIATIMRMKSKKYSTSTSKKSSDRVGTANSINTNDRTGGQVHASARASANSSCYYVMPNSQDVNASIEDWSGYQDPGELQSPTSNTSPAEEESYIMVVRPEEEDTTRNGSTGKDVLQMKMHENTAYASSVDLDLAGASITANDMLESQGDSTIGMTPVKDVKRGYMLCISFFFSTCRYTISHGSAAEHIYYYVKYLLTVLM